MRFSDKRPERRREQAAQEGAEKPRGKVPRHGQPGGSRGALKLHREPAPADYCRRKGKAEPARRAAAQRRYAAAELKKAGQRRPRLAEGERREPGEPAGKAVKKPGAVKDGDQRREERDICADVYDPLGRARDSPRKRAGFRGT